MKSFTQIFVLLKSCLLAILPVSAVTGSEFSFVETQYAHINHNDIDADAGIGIELSIPFNDSWYVTGSNTQSKITSDLDQQLDFTNWFLGVGHFWSWSTTSDIYLQISAETQKLEAEAGRFDKRGASIELGNHYWISDQWLLTIYGRFSDINISDVSDRSSELYFGARLSYKLSESFKLGIGIESGDFDRSELALRFNF